MLLRSANWCRHLQVPYTLVDEDIPDDWSCADNVWDPSHRSCDVPQALSDERIDEILLQQVQLEVCCQLLSLETSLTSTPMQTLHDGRAQLFLHSRSC